VEESKIIMFITLYYIKDVFYINQFMLDRLAVFCSASSPSKILIFLTFKGLNLYLRITQYHFYNSPLGVIGIESLKVVWAHDGSQDKRHPAATVGLRHCP